MARLVLIDTSDQLPGLLPLHAWSALMSAELVLIGAADHPFLPELEAAELRYEVLAGGGQAALSRADLLSGVTPARKAQAEHVIDRARELGEIVYLFGPADEDAFNRMLGMEAARAGVEVEVVYFMHAPKGVRLLELVRTEERLLGPGGCPWDRKQTHSSLARYAVEELYELLEAIAENDVDGVREELGDLLLQVVFHAQMAENDDRFDIDDVAAGITEKLVRRHPHVFGDVDVADADEVIANWEELKAEEKPERSGVFEGVPPGQPALGYAQKLQSRAARTGFEWPDDADAAARVREELDELVAAGSDAERVHELGDLLLSVVGLARRHSIDPELALRGAARRFRRRFETVVDAADRPLQELSPTDWRRLWEAAKEAEAASQPPSGEAL